MHNPPHPGDIIKQSLLDVDLSITKAAKQLGVKRQTLSRVINGEGRITAFIAIGLGKLFGTTSQSWLTQQMNYDLWKENEKATKQCS